MKILLLNPSIDAEHNIAKTLQQRGAAILYPADAEEAWQMLQLHGSSIELAVVHREGVGAEKDTPGIAFVNRLKADPTFSDLPLILTTSSWGDAECAAHQETPAGANAYLQESFEGPQLVELIEAVMGRALQPAKAPAPPKRKREPEGPSSAGVILEETSAFYLSETPEPTSLTIKLEAPDLESSDEPAGLMASAPPPLVHEPEAEAGSLALAIDTGFGFPAEADVVAEAPPIAIEAPQVLEEAPQENFEATRMQSFDEGFDLLTAVPPSQESSQFEEGSSHSVHEVDGPDNLESDPEIAQEMPYLFKKTTPAGIDPAYLFSTPVGDSVVPGGAANSPDLETVKKYLQLREQDVSILSNQLKASHDQGVRQDLLLREERAKNAELTHMANEQKRKLEEFERLKRAAIEGLQSEITDLNFQIKARTDKARILESQVREYTEQTEQLKERVRLDIRKIRIREKELENRLEIVKKDSEALIAARETKIIELKRKLDLLEFNMDLLQEQYTREKDNSLKLREKLEKAAQIVRMAGGLLDSGKTASKSLLSNEDGQDNAESGVVEPDRLSGEDRKVS